MDSVPQEFVSESLADTIECKTKAAAFLKNRDKLNDAAATAWCQDYTGIPCATSYGLCIWCWTRLTYVGGCEFVGEYIIESSDIYNKITNKIKTVWKDIKKEDENENDTIAALILGLARLESLGEIVVNYLNIHETFVSPEQYDIEAKRYARSLLLGNKKEYKKEIEICIENDYTNHTNGGLLNTCYIMRPK